MSGRGSADSASDATREDLKLKPMVGYIRMNANVIELYSKSENLGYWDDNFKYDLGGDLFTRLTEVYKDGVLFPVLEDSRVLHTWPQPRASRRLVHEMIVFLIAACAQSHIH